jgi:hypothetical protein
VRGAWQFRADELYTTSVGDAQMIVRTDIDLDDVRVDVRGVLTDHDWQTSFHNLGALAWADTGGDGLMCDGIGDGRMSAIAMHVVEDNVAMYPLVEDYFLWQVLEDEQFRVRTEVRNGEVVCTLQSLYDIVTTDAVQAPSMSNRQIAIRSNRFAVRITSVVVYEIGN